MGLQARRLAPVLLVCALMLSLMSAAPPALAPAVVSHPGGTVVEVVQGDEFVLSFRLRWDEDAKGYFSLGISWDSPRVDNGGTPSENFTFVEARAYFDNLDPIYVEAMLGGGPSPDNENMWWYAVVVGHGEGDPRNGEFNVDIVLRASGAGNVPHAPTENHPIRIVGTIDVPEETFYSFTPPTPTITVRVLKYRNPAGDASVSSEWPNQNFGAENILKVYHTPGGEARAFLKFSLASLPSGASITSARLYLYCYEMAWGMWPMEAHAVENDSWSENIITWNNQPSYGALLDSYEGLAGAWWTWDVTTFVASEFAGDKVASFCLVPSPEQEGYFYSKEAALNRPYLEVAYTSSESSASSTSENTSSAGDGGPSAGGSSSGSEDPIATAYRKKALRHISQISGTPIEELWIYDTWANYPLTGRRLYAAKIAGKKLGSEINAVYIDENGEIVDDETIKNIRRKEREAALGRYGKLEPAMREFLRSKGDDEMVSCTIWLRFTHRLPPKPEYAIREEGYAEYEQKYRQMLKDSYALHQKPVMDFLNASGFQVKYVSRYAPAICAELPKWMIIKLQEMPEVDMIYLAKTYRPAADSAASTMRAPRVWGEGITGAGIKVAVVESPPGLINFANPYLKEGLAYRPSADPDSHATAIAGIIASTHSKIRGIAYGAPGLLSANPLPFDLAGIMAATEWAMDNGARIINNSWRFPTQGQMDDTARYFDHVVRCHCLTVVCAAGNDRYPYCNKEN